MISQTEQPQQLREVLAAAHGIVGRVIKQRTLVMAGRTRIHLDRVNDLGEFLELEVVLDEHEDEAVGIAEAHALMRQLGVVAEQLIETAYVDLLRQKS